MFTLPETFEFLTRADLDMKLNITRRESLYKAS